MMKYFNYLRLNLTSQKARVDRFVVPREFLPEKCRRMNMREEYSADEIWSTKHLQRKRYMAFLNEAFHLNPPKELQVKKRLYTDWSWPCEPRKRSCLSTADNVLDLPTYSFATFPDLIDWSKDDILVAALGRRYHKWSWQSQSSVGEGMAMYNIQCCKFDPKGNNLLLGTDLRVEVHDKENKRFFVQYCKCSLSFCVITTIDWSPTGNSFATGCSRGMISCMNTKNYPIKCVQLLEGATNVVRVSPNARFVAVAGIHASIVWILSWPELKRFRFLRTYVTVKDLNWHPWQTALLGIALLHHDKHASVVMWEPHSEKLRQERIGQGLYSIDTMKFNYRTGEMLLSLWSLGINAPYPKCSELVVMSDFNTVVDHWGGGRTGLNRIRTMVFSPDGTKLATATADEDLVIWNFLPNNYKKNKPRQNFTDMPKFLDLISLGYSIR